MIIYQHRLNTPEEILHSQYGLEIDIRSNNNKLIVTHDAFYNEFIYLDQIKENLRNKSVIFNVKEEGLEEKLKSTFSVVEQNSSFILDETVPYMIKYCRDGFCKFSIRVSEIETIHSALNINKYLKEFKSKIEWVWVDCFTLKPPSRQTLEALKEEGLNICLVSPELHILSKPNEWKTLISCFQESLGNSVLLIDGVCTKVPKLWL
jgi:hypothetical protein